MSTHSFVKSKLNHNCQDEKETTRGLANLLVVGGWVEKTPAID